MLYLIAGCAEGNRAQVSNAWRAIDAAFLHQQSDGSFDEGSRPHRGAENDHGIPFFIDQLCEALLVLRASPIGSEYEARMETLFPRIEKSAQWIAAHHKELARADRNAPNRLFADANALALSGFLMRDRRLEKKSRAFLDKALALQSPEGYFLESGGADSSYNAVNILQLEKYAFYFKDDRLGAAVRSSVNWELTRILPSGEVSTQGNSRTGVGKESFMGKPKGVNYEEVVLALFLYGEQFEDESAGSAARKIFQYHFGNR